jgi:hypothetical protein
MLHVYLDVLSARNIVSQKTNMFCIMYKKENFGAN